MKKGRLYNGVGPLRTTEISYNPVSTTLDTPIYLPSSEPAEDDFSYTVAEEHLPVITGAPLKYTLCALLVQSGFNENSSTTRNVSHRFLINDASIVTSSTLNANANQFWALTHNNTFNIKVGDKVSCRVWSTNQTSDIYWDYQGLIIIITRAFSMKTVICKDLNFDVFTPALLPGIAAGATSSSRIYHGIDTGSLGNYRTASSVAVIRFNLFMQNSTYGLWQSGRGDQTLSSIIRSNAARQMNTADYSPHFSYRPVGGL